MVTHARLFSTIFSQVYNRISGAGVGIHSLGVSFDEARMWHQRAYGGLVSQIPIDRATKLDKCTPGHNQCTDSPGNRLWLGI